MKSYLEGIQQSLAERILYSIVYQYERPGKWYDYLIM